MSLLPLPRFGPDLNGIRFVREGDREEPEGLLGVLPGEYPLQMLVIVLPQLLIHANQEVSGQLPLPLQPHYRAAAGDPMIERDILVHQLAMLIQLPVLVPIQSYGG